MPQTTVTYKQNQWLAEGQVGSTVGRTIDGAIQYAKAGASVVPFGRVAELDPATNIITPLSGAPSGLLVIPIFTEKFGIKLDDFAANSSANIGYPANYESVEYITEGDVVMYSETAGNIGVAAAYRHTAAASPNDVVGRIRNAVVTNEAVALTTLVYAEQIAAAGLVLMRVRTLAGL